MTEHYKEYHSGLLVLQCCFIRDERADRVNMFTVALLKNQIYFDKMVGNNTRSKTKEDDKISEVQLQSFCEKILTSEEFLTKLIETISNKLPDIFQKQFKEYEQKVKSLEDRIDVLEQQARGNKLLIFGVPESNQREPRHDKNMTAKILKEKVDETISEDQIESCYRLKSNKKPGPKPVIITFTSKSARDAVFYNKSKLKGSKMVIKEYLTIKRYKLLTEAGNSLGYLNVWTNGGQVVKRQLAAVTYYCYFGPGRNIVKQYHKPQAMYFVMSGEAAVIVRRFDKVLQEWVEEVTGTITAGTMFGEVALLHGINRLATISTITPCELLMIKKEDFDLVLRATVLKAWEEIQKIMNKFTYFKNWDSVTKRECSIVSRTKSYDPDETILGDGYGMSTCVYFITKGSAYIVEHLNLKVVNDKGIKKYTVNIPMEDAVKTREEARLSNILKRYIKNSIPQVGSDAELSSHYTSSEIVKSTVSLKTTTPTTESLSKSYYSQVPTNEFDGTTHFIKVCELTEGACFNIGENLARRRVVAKVPTNCLLVPRYWIMKNNKDNIWNMVIQFLNQEIPSTKKIFKRYVEEQKFKTYRKGLIRDLLAQKKVSNNNSIHNVPYSIRLKEGTDVDYH